MKNKKIVGLVFLLFFVFSCKKDQAEVNFHENYFPLMKGKFVEYDVTYIKHISASVHDTVKSVLKTYIGDTLIDNEGRIAHRFYRSIFNPITQLFETKDLWTATISDSRAELVEENNRIIKLVFAPTVNKEWDINAFNFREPLTVFYENIHKPFSINGFDFDSTVTVIEEKTDVTLVSYSLKTETYAKNIGLVNKYFKELKISDFDTLKPYSGEELYYKIRNYGVE